MRDPILDRLRAADPAAAERMPGPESPGAQLILREIIAQPRPEPPASRGLRPRRLIAAVAVATLALASLAAAHLALRPVDEPAALTCYAGLDLDSDAVGLRLRAGLDPAAACARVWEDGTLADPELAAPGAVPPLTACVTGDGSLAVFPTGDADHCDRPGLGRPDPASLVEGEVVRELGDRLAGYFATRPCVAMSEAEAEVASVLGDLGLAGWSVQVEQPTPGRPCASFGLEAELRTVFLVPIPSP